MSCISKNINSVVILKLPKRMLEYYSSKGLLFLNEMLIIWKNVRIIHAEETDNPDKVMTYINTITSTWNKLKNLAVNKILHYSYIQTEFNNKKEMIINIFSAYVVPLLKYINHPELLQEWKLNLDAAQQERNIDS